MVELRAKYTLKNAINKERVDGSSPPSIFIGRIGYPRINVYPATPPMHGDTSNLENPKTWLSMRLEDFISSRLSLIRGSIRVRVEDARIRLGHCMMYRSWRYQVIRWILS